MEYNLGDLSSALVANSKHWGLEDDKDSWQKTIKQEVLTRMAAAILVPLAAIADAFYHLAYGTLHYTLGSANSLINRFVKSEFLEDWTTGKGKHHYQLTRDFLFAITTVFLGIRNPQIQRNSFVDLSLLSDRHHSMRRHYGYNEYNEEPYESEERTDQKMTQSTESVSQSNKTEQTQTPVKEKTTTEAVTANKGDTVD